jgi:hypothetical protein
MRGFYCTPPQKAPFIGILLCFVFSFSINLFFNINFIILTKQFHTFLLNIVLQLDPLKLGSCKFNIIIFIINITPGLGVATKPKTLGSSFAYRPNTLESYLFLYFLCQKN